MPKNPFQALSDIYDEGVKEYDKKNTAELYRQATENFFRFLEGATKYHVQDVKYLDGYFVFGTGTNSVVHFHVKECKHWLFGLWWNYDEYTEKVTGEFFTRNEDDLDKFKPSRSTYCFTINNNGRYSGDVVDTLRYIHKYPLRAWQRDMYGTYEFGIKCLLNYIGYHLKETKNNILQSILDKLFLRFVKRKILFWADHIAEDGTYCEAEIIDLGDTYSPRYDIQCKIPDNDSIETGCYSLFYKLDDPIQNKLMQQDKARWGQMEKKLKKVSDIFNVYWYTPIDDNVTYWNQKGQDEE